MNGTPRNGGLTTVKVDAETHRLIGDLAHLLGRTRGEVVRDAVNAFAVWREGLLDDGADAAALRVALASARHHARLVSGELATADAERADRSRVGTTRLSLETFGRLTTHERFEVRRIELEHAFAALGARNPRLVGAREHGHRPGTVVIAVDLDDPARFAYGELLAIGTEILWEIVDVVASNGRRPTLLDRAATDQVRPIS
jgi:hypothetical protein